MEQATREKPAAIIGRPVGEHIRAQIRIPDGYRYGEA